MGKAKRVNIFAIDTTTKYLCLGVYASGRVCLYRLQLGRKQSAFIAPNIERVLGALEMKVGDIDYFACGIGPGSFSGIRMGIATVKGLAFVAQKPVTPISSLDILAHNAGNAYSLSRRLIVPVIDAKRNLVYCSAYRYRAGILNRVMPYRLLPISGLLKKIGRGSIILGDGLETYEQDFIQAARGYLLLDKDYWYPRPASLIEIALRHIKEGNLQDAVALRALYLYPKECQLGRV